MKKTVRFTALLLAMVSIFSVFGAAAFADGLKSGSEMFEGVTRSSKEQQKVEAIYEDLIRRAYEFDEDILLPELKHMNDYDEIRIKYVQGKRGKVRGQSIYVGPDDSEPRWSIRDGQKVKVYAKYKDYSFVEVMMNDKESEGTIGWIPTTYIVNKWSEEVSRVRTKQFGG